MRKIFLIVSLLCFAIAANESSARAGAYYAIIEITDETQSETQTVLRKIGIKN